MKHLIIGAGPSGVIAAETLRKLQPEASVTIVGDEAEPPYSRMALPYLLIRKVGEEGTYLRKNAGHYDRLRIDVKRDRVTGVDTTGRKVQLAGGGALAYDKLLLATGSRPVSPPIPGMALPGIYPCWTLTDARHIAGGAVPGAKVVLMGAGFIGCIILEALAKRGVDLTVVEMADRMVPRMMNNIAGNLIKRWCEEKGVHVHTSTRVVAIEPGTGGRRFAVRLDGGTVLAADLIISATGVKPNVEFLEGSGVKTDHGILIDRQMQTSNPDVYAAGDVAQGLDFSTGEYSVQAIQPTAADHGQLAARNMGGRRGAIHRGSVNMNVLDTLGLISSSFGLWMGAKDGESTELCDPGRYRYLNLQFEDDVLVGATSLGLTEHVGVLRGLIQTRTRLREWKDKLVKDPTRIMEAYLGSTQAVGFNAGLI
ncbi:MAG: NAD(P)/FAD-dependent oxidoreductase [Gammaproteobacteria bacterium]|nr:NAD(P)/FAD-dependent oxidoreductase [Gammaproteobacteria bacterium]